MFRSMVDKASLSALASLLLDQPSMQGEGPNRAARRLERAKYRRRVKKACCRRAYRLMNAELMRRETRGRIDELGVRP